MTYTDHLPGPSKGDVCDIENFSEYEGVVKKLLERWPTRPITVFVDMKDIDCAAKKVCIPYFRGN